MPQPHRKRLALGRITLCLGAVACGAVACGEDANQNSTASGGGTATLDTQLAELKTAAKVRRQAMCTCLFDLQSEDVPDAQSCVNEATDDFLVSFDSACVDAALASDSAAGANFVSCAIDAERSATTCWQGCGTSLDDHLLNYNCYEKAGAAFIACGEGLSKTAQDAVSDCSK